MMNMPSRARSSAAERVAAFVIWVGRGIVEGDWESWGAGDWGWRLSGMIGRFLSDARLMDQYNDGLRKLETKYSYLVFLWHVRSEVKPLPRALGWPPLPEACMLDDVRSVPS